MELNEKILLSVIEVFGDKGLRLTMDDVARHMSISKKTLYQVYPTKEDMFLAVADYCFADIKRCEKAIVQDPDMDIVEKIRSIIVVLPDRYQNIGLQNLYQLKDKHPTVYTQVARYLATDWDATIALLKEGMAQGRIKPISIPVVKAMVEGTIQHYLSSDILVENGLSYEQGLSNMIDIIIDGICA